MILCIETSASTCSVAIGYGEQLFAEHTLSAPEGGHAAALAPLVDELLGKAHKAGITISAVALSAGPGSYTGLRIGASLAKGLCFGLKIPLIALDTLEIIAHQAIHQLPPKSPITVIHPMIDARRMEVYTASFSTQGERLEEDHPLVLEADLPPTLEKGKHLFAGDGAGKVRDLWHELEYEVWDEGFAPSAQGMIHLASHAFREKTFVDIAYWTPKYLKDYVAVVATNKVLNR